MLLPLTLPMRMTGDVGKGPEFSLDFWLWLSRPTWGGLLGEALMEQYLQETCPPSGQARLLSLTCCSHQLLQRDHLPLPLFTESSQTLKSSLCGHPLFIISSKDPMPHGTPFSLCLLLHLNRGCRAQPGQGQLHFYIEMNCVLVPDLSALEKQGENSCCSKKHF